MVLKKSLPLPPQYNNELAYWATRLTDWQLSKSQRIRIIEAVKGIEK